MAQRGKKTAAAPKKSTVRGKKSSAKKSSAKKKSSTKKQDTVNKELVVMSYAAVAIILLAIFILFPPTATISGVGVIGIYLSDIFSILFGKGRFVFPLLLLAVGFFLWQSEKKEFPKKRCITFSIVLFLAVITFMNIDATMTGFSAFMGEASKSNMGGIFGGFFAFLFLKAFDETLSVIILLLIIIVSLVAVSGLSFLNLMEKTGKGVSKATNKSVKVINKAVQERREQAPLRKKAAANPEDSFSYVYEDEEMKEKDGDKDEDSFAPVVYDMNEPDMELQAGADDGRVIEGEPEDDGLAGVLFDGENIAFDDITPYEDEDDYNAEKLDILTYDDHGESHGEEKEKTAASVLKEEAAEKENPAPKKKPYRLPKITLLPKRAAASNKKATKSINESVEILENTLKSFGVEAKVTEVTFGPSLIRYEVQPGVGVKVSKIVGLSDDIALQLAATGIRMEAPVPGKSVIGIEVPRIDKAMVSFREILENSRFFEMKSNLSCAFGKDITGKPVIGDLAEMPHLLIAGTTGSGKSVCVNTIICSILFKASPDEVKFIMIDPKQVEFVVYEGLPHLITPVVTDPKKAAGSLKWVLREMENRYTLFNQNKVRNLEGYNKLVEEGGEKLPQIVVFIDELADLMMVAAKDVEDAICRLAQKARAAGIHLVVATQRPSVDVITGLIKANMPSRIALSVSSQTDSRTILDMGGAEKLMGKGDMLYYPVGMAKPLRVQGAFLDETVIKPVVEHCKQLGEPEYIEGVAQPVEMTEMKNDTEDELFHDAAKAVIAAGQASASMLQRRFRIGYNRAARLIEVLQSKGIVGPSDGAKPRVVLMSAEAFDAQFPPQPGEQNLFDEN